MVFALLASGITYGITAFLSTIGFTVVGPAAGTLAAWVQAVVYGGAVPAGSLFAMLQSIGMGGAIGAAGLASGGLLLTGLVGSIFVATFPILSPFLPADVYRTWIHDTVMGTTQVSLRELLCSAGGVCSRLLAKF